MGRGPSCKDLWCVYRHMRVTASLLPLTNKRMYVCCSFIVGCCLGCVHKPREYTIQRREEAGEEEQVKELKLVKAAIRPSFVMALSAYFKCFLSPRTKLAGTQVLRLKPFASAR